MTDCVFCDPEKIKTRTIASLDGVNIVPTLGQITEGGYVLIIPTKHVSCIGAMESKDLLIIERLTCRLIRALEMTYQNSVTIFEHGIVGQTIKHAHLHFLPVQLDLGSRIRSDFPESEIQEFELLSDFQLMYENRQEPYLLWSIRPGIYSVCWNPPAPPQYLRTVSAELLNVPERADWKKMDPELDNKLIDETIRMIAPFFGQIINK